MAAQGPAGAQSPLRASTSSAEPHSSSPQHSAPSHGSPRPLRSSASAFIPSSPHSPSKRPCRYFKMGVCMYGDKCWFKHEAPGEAEQNASAQDDVEEEDTACAVCLEAPTFYGLLENCSHIFCFSCINKWRTIEGKSSEQILSGALSACPICRMASTFVCQSPIFYPAGPEKQVVIAQMKHKLSQIDCKHYKPGTTAQRPCPFGSDCLYRHLKPDGTHDVLNYTRQQWLESAHRPRSVEEDWLLDILMQAASGRDASEILRRITGRRQPVDRSSLSQFIQSLQNMGLGQDAGDEDEWVDEESEMGEEMGDEEDDETDADMPPLEYIEDSGDEQISTPPATSANAGSRPLPPRAIRPLPRRRPRQLSGSSGSSMPPLESVRSSGEEDEMPNLDAIDSESDGDVDAMPPLEGVDSEDDTTGLSTQYPGLHVPISLDDLD